MSNEPDELINGQVSARDLQVFVLLMFQGASPDSVAQLHAIDRNNVDQIKHRVGKLFGEGVEALKKRWNSVVLV